MHTIMVHQTRYCASPFMQFTALRSSSGDTPVDVANRTGNAAVARHIEDLDARVAKRASKTRAGMDARCPQTLPRSPTPRTELGATWGVFVVFVCVCAPSFPALFAGNWQLK